MSSSSVARRRRTAPAAAPRLAMVRISEGLTKASKGVALEARHGGARTGERRRRLRATVVKRRGFLQACNQGNEVPRASLPTAQRQPKRTGARESGRGETTALTRRARGRGAWCGGDSVQGAVEAVPRRAATSMQGYGSPAWGSSSGGSFSHLLLLPSSVSSPFFLSLGGGDGRGIPLVARVFGVRPWGFYRRGTTV